MVVLGGSVGFRGCPLCPSSHSPFQSLLYSPPTNTRHFETAETLGVGEGGKGEIENIKRGNTPIKSWIWGRNSLLWAGRGVPWGSLGFRGCPLCPSSHFPCPSIPYSALPTTNSRCETAETLCIGKGGRGNEKSKSWKTPIKSCIWGRNSLLCVFRGVPWGSVGFRGVPWGSAVVQCAHLSIICSPRCHIPPFAPIRCVSQPPKL